MQIVSAITAGGSTAQAQILHAFPPDYFIYGIILLTFLGLARVAATAGSPER
jgi:hypothetical protein